MWDFSHTSTWVGCYNLPLLRPEPSLDLLRHTDRGPTQACNITQVESPHSPSLEPCSDTSCDDLTPPTRYCPVWASLRPAWFCFGPDPPSQAQKASCWLRDCLLIKSPPPPTLWAMWDFSHIPCERGLFEGS